MFVENPILANRPYVYPQRRVRLCQHSATVLDLLEDPNARNSIQESNWDLSREGLRLHTVEVILKMFIFIPADDMGAGGSVAIALTAPFSCAMQYPSKVTARKIGWNLFGQLKRWC